MIKSNEIVVPEKYFEARYEYTEGYRIGQKQKAPWKVRHNPVNEMGIIGELRKDAWEAGKRAGQRWRNKMIKSTTEHLPYNVERIYRQPKSILLIKQGMEVIGQITIPDDFTENLWREMIGTINGHLLILNRS